ncbi:TPA: hypothetical protein VAM20_002323 [Acinetobacter baumannii]|nr:hypothetical protein [Acinetobacter baumannii]
MSMFKVGDFVLYEKTYYTYEVVETTITNVFALKHSKTKRIYAMPHISRLKLASPEEIAAGHRIDKPSNSGELETLDKLENHISPNCKVEDV